MIRTIAAIRAACERTRAEGRTVGFVPTMGAFHEGHRSLMRRSKDERDVTVVSIFVNPLQFGDARDLETYPRDEQADLAVAERDGVDLVFAPSVDEMYPDGEPEVTVDPGPLGERLEGASRPGHFRGVATVVAKLFDAVGPCPRLLRREGRAAARGDPEDGRRPVAADRGPVLPVVREPDGLALSSRNRLLTPDQREAATCLFLALSEAAELARAGERDAGRLVAAMAREIGATSEARIDYVAVVDEETFEEVGDDRRPGPGAGRRPLRRGAADRQPPAPRGVRIPGMVGCRAASRRGRMAGQGGDERVLLAVNVGNTNTVLGVFRGPELEHQWRLSTETERTADELAVLFAGLLDQTGLSFSNEITGVVISSVVPGSTTALREMVTRYFNFPAVVVEPGTRTGLSIQTDNPREVGADRIVNALAAFSRYGGPCIVIDFGTATTYDVVSEKGEFLGGAIAPGVQTSNASLSRRDGAAAAGRAAGAEVADRAEHRRGDPVGADLRDRGRGRRDRSTGSARSSGGAPRSWPPAASPRGSSRTASSSTISTPGSRSRVSGSSSNATSDRPMPDEVTEERHRARTRGPPDPTREPRAARRPGVRAEPGAGARRDGARHGVEHPGGVRRARAATRSTRPGERWRAGSS